MPRSGRFAILAAECALAPRSLLFANGVQVQAATQTYTGKHIVADSGSVMGTVFNFIAWNPSTHGWMQLSARATHDDLIRIGAESLATGPVYPSNLHTALEIHTLDKASNGAIYCSADGASEYRLHRHRFVEHLSHSRSHCPADVDFELYEVFYAGGFAHYI